MNEGAAVGFCDDFYVVDSLHIADAHLKEQLSNVPKTAGEIIRNLEFEECSAGSRYLMLALGALIGKSWFVDGKRVHLFVEDGGDGLCFSIRRC